MTKHGLLPRVLVIDDVLGRSHDRGRNEERANLCGAVLLRDVTGDEDGPTQDIAAPVAEAVFFRGQSPVRSGIGARVENDLEACLAEVRAGWTGRAPGEQPWSLVLLDLCFYTGMVTSESDQRKRGMPEGRPRDSDPSEYFGLRVLEAIGTEFPGLPVVLLSSTSRDDVSRSLSVLGALGFLNTGDLELRRKLEDYLWRHALSPDATGTIVGYSSDLLAALRAARRSSPAAVSVLVQGERGTGKELLAAFLHRCSPNRATGPFVAVDAGALPPELYASELFGHLRGAFTGATANRVGKIEHANGGDLFLDEIGNMPAEVQKGMIRVLQDRHVIPVGANEGVDVDVRVVAATNQDIEGKVDLGQFKADLLDRLRTGGVISLPPLRQRRLDIPLLVDAFFREAVAENPNATVRELSPDALAAIEAEDWPGNVRQLRACVRKAVQDHPDVDYLYPLHFELSRRTVSPASLRVPIPPSVDAAEARQTSQSGLARAAEVLEQIDVGSVATSDLAGSLPPLRRAYARLVARLARAALEATKRHSPENPSGKVLIHPAMKLLQGDSSLTASAAADLLKRSLSIAPDAVADLMQDELLGEGYKRAVKIRPTKVSRRDNEQS